MIFFSKNTILEKVTYNIGILIGISLEFPMEKYGENSNIK